MGVLLKDIPLNRKVFTTVTGEITVEELGDLMMMSVLQEGANPNSTWIEVLKELDLEHEIQSKIKEIDANPYFQEHGLTSKDFEQWEYSAT